nr:immunoglobulin light chain junction region [Macaca mulatta]MOX97760.1 immunoglobulin light chain junction region [Macaca mulatta]
FMQPLEFPWTF